MEYLEASKIKKMIKKPLLPADTYAIIRMIQMNEPESVQKLFRFYRITKDSFERFCRKNNIKLDNAEIRQ